MKHQVVVHCPICPKLHMSDKSPEDIYMPIFSHSHSATYWQQEMTCFTFWSPPRELTTSPSNVVRKCLRPWWYFIIKIVSFNPTALSWQRDKFQCATMKQQPVLTPQYKVKSAPNFTCLIRVPAWRPPTDNRKSALRDKDNPIYMKFTWRGLHMMSSNTTYN